MSNRLSQPFYGRNNSQLDFNDDQRDSSTFKVLSTSLETPYDTAKKRQSEILSSPKKQALRSQASNLDLSTTPQYKVDRETTTKRKKSDYPVKLVVVGDGGCGKTCLLISYSRGEFPTEYVPTIFENYITYVEGTDGKSVELALWDTAGQEEYDRLRPLSYQNVNVLLICYSVGSVISLNNVKEKWAPEVEHFCPNIPIVLVGTKSDLLQDRGFLLSNAEYVEFQDAEEVARDIGAKHHVRCSAKTTENISQVFNLAVAVGLEKASSSGFSGAKGKKSVKDKIKRRIKGESNDEDDLGYNDEYGTFEGKRRKHRCVIL